LNKLLQHVSETLATYATSTIYFCNIHMKQLQHTSKTLETCICNIGQGEHLCRSNLGIEVGASGKWRRASTNGAREHQRHQHRALVGWGGSAGDTERAPPAPARVTGWGERRAQQGASERQMGRATTVRRVRVRVHDRTTARRCNRGEGSGQDKDG
jgi:hypothetical protein